MKKKELKQRNKKLQYKTAIEKYWHKLARKDSKFWQEVVIDQDIEIKKLKAEIAELKAPKLKVWVNGEEVEDNNSWWTPPFEIGSGSVSSDPDAKYKVWY